MSAEVKIVYADATRKLNEISRAAESMSPQVSPSIVSDELDVMQKLTVLMDRQAQLYIRYQKILQENLRTTEQSIESMRALDEQIAATIGTGKVTS